MQDFVRKQLQEASPLRDQYPASPALRSLFPPSATRAPLHVFQAAFALALQGFSLFRCCWCIWPLFSCDILRYSKIPNRLIQIIFFNIHHTKCYFGLRFDPHRFGVISTVEKTWSTTFPFSDSGISHYSPSNLVCGDLLKVKTCSYWKSSISILWPLNNRG